MSINYIKAGYRFSDGVVSGEIVHIDKENEQIQIKQEDGSYRIVSVKNSNEIKTQSHKNVDHELHFELTRELHETYLRKNMDYGNSFSDQYKEYGILSAVIRLDDKIRRIKQLMKNEAQVNDESMLDSAKDLSNYALMLSMELIKENKEKQK